ncbi:MAG TPA: LuxR C-terminal-related transcriptional regulator [Chryseolinea sp.]|nr:LuxR C-terminal-related transcriptional regulator [Chryseolinea sp.]HPH46372.1 LuxR C-terminal-related transcriptional regulator [Chryseolinea sp.]HPM32543.1 LuxR C-terminal-related transcriptional regulator [Chryseolinea sp.]
MKRTIILYGLSLAALLFLMQWLQFGFIIRDLSLEFYLGVVAVVFTAIGIWAGLRLTQAKTKVVLQTDFSFNEVECNRLGISKRELEVLQLMAQGFSNQEIADKLFVSLNTVKTHSSNLFLKLEVRRRTQAVQRSKELMLIP